MTLHVAEPRVGYALKAPDDASRLMTAEEFLAWDEQQPERWEYVRGEVFMMTGGADRNYTVGLNLAFALRQHLRGTPCRVYGSDIKLRVDASNCFFYPDLMVTCSARDARDRLIKREPTLVVEILSPSTAAYDRGEKFADYRELPSLREYLLVDVQRRVCDLYRLGEQGLWVLHPLRGDAELHLASVGLTLPAAELWADLEPDAAGDEDAAGEAPAAPAA